MDRNSKEINVAKLNLNISARGRRINLTCNIAVTTQCDCLEE